MVKVMKVRQETLDNANRENNYASMRREMAQYAKETGRPVVVVRAEDGAFVERFGA